jgi:lipopolysaccharide export system protein LptA
MKPVKGIGLLIILFFLTLLFTSGEAQEKKTKTGSAKGFGFTSSRSPVEITSDTVEGDQKQNQVTFKGNVVAKQEEATLYANTVVVHYDTEMKKMKEIVATGNVRIMQLDRRATCQKATFYQIENKIVLDGEAVIREGDNVVRGERVVYLVDEERSYVEGGKGGRVITTITPSSKEEKKKQ